MRTILIISGSSDIGNYLIRQYLKKDDKVITTYRTAANFNGKGLEGYIEKQQLVLIPLNISNMFQAQNLYDYFEQMKLKWDLIVFLNATLTPIGKFMDVNINLWERGIMQNTIQPIGLLQKLYKFRNSSRICDICFFSGGGVNGTFNNFSAYTISKFIFHKFAELLNSEYDDLNPFVLGPSYVKTKIHNEVLSNPRLAGETHKKTLDFIASGNGTPLKDIFDCIEFCCNAGKEAVGGRNIAVAHDPWKTKKFVKILKDNPHWGKMRRYV